MKIFGEPNGYKVLENTDIFKNALGNIKYVRMVNRQSSSTGVRLTTIKGNTTLKIFPPIHAIPI